ncbi:hypothetical protein EVAR_5896_1 [Eumeta japonica]|uniref:Uncharacterized protein n=1 Tax=Eumeta variegata TaxID=151549 RepID=A0A4C1TD50_EUMVA|nr:hypothetical protein EVAR_5896_1 [Eumeta japonica]
MVESVGFAPKGTSFEFETDEFTIEFLTQVKLNYLLRHRTIDFRRAHMEGRRQIRNLRRGLYELKRGRRGFKDEARTVRPPTAVTLENVQSAGKLI